MAAMDESFAWLEDQERLEVEIAEAMKSSEIWLDGCVAGAVALGASEKEARDDGNEWSSWAWDDTDLFRFTTIHIAGSSWALTVRKVAGHAFLISNSEEPFEEHVWAWWTPPDDPEALERAVRDTWRAHWGQIPLPPFFSGGDVLWEGPKENYALAHANLDAVLVEDDYAWAEFRERLPEVLEGLRGFVEDGIDLASIVGNAPRPAYDLAWLEAITAGPFLDGCRTDEAARRSLVSYFLMA